MGAHSTNLMLERMVNKFNHEMGLLPHPNEIDTYDEYAYIQSPFPDKYAPANRFKRSEEGIVDLCCRQACSVSTLTLFCET